MLCNNEISHTLFTNKLTIIDVIIFTNYDALLSFHNLKEMGLFREIWTIPLKKIIYF